MSTKINWTNETWNPISGCTKISPGCDQCYAEKMAYRLRNIALSKDKPSNIDYYVDIANDWGVWSGKTILIEPALQKPLKWKKPKKIFVCSMGDLFHPSVKFEWIDKVFNIIQKCPQHTFQILTKRPEVMKAYFESRCIKKPYLNVWLGVTVENQEQADKRIPILLQIPDVIRFISAEPLLSKIDISIHLATGWTEPPYDDILNWVIIGGETGPKARPMHPGWLNSLVGQCESAETPIFFKSFGEWVPEFHPEAKDCCNYKISDEFVELTEDKTDYSGVYMYRVGKKKADSRIFTLGLDYKQFPKL